MASFLRNLALVGVTDSPVYCAENRTEMKQKRKENAMQAPQDNYFAGYGNLKLTRDAKGILVAQFHSDGGPFIMTAQAHTEFVDAFYRIAQDRANKIVILTGAGGQFITDVDWSSFGDASDPGVWSQVHDEGVQVLENIANIRVPVIAAVEGRAHVHSDYALLASVIVAAQGATFQDVAHFAAGIAPGDGVFTTWSYRAGPGRAEAFLLNPQPLTARIAHEWGVVAEVVPNGKALSRARELGELYLKAPEVTRRNTRVHFIQPLKERIVREVGYGLSLEGASAADLVKSKTELPIEA
ncbi:MAG TPA: enoyl-CoA hydratase/isomerase family protein [Candidatus Acidoferrum sp.]|nr:enoyl-CoA hydratase/isomerase family protein [Candidatus Acidoferrum sp.]